MLVGGCCSPPVWTVGTPGWTPAPGGELMTGVAVPLLLALLQLDDDEEVDMFEHDPIEQHEEEEEEELLELLLEPTGLRRLRSLFGLATPLLLLFS